MSQGLDFMAKRTFAIGNAASKRRGEELEHFANGVSNDGSGLLSLSREMCSSALKKTAALFYRGAFDRTPRPQS